MTATDAGTAQPADAADARRAIDAALAQSDLPRAIALARRAVDRGFKDPLFHNLIAHELQGLGRYAEAMAELQRAYELAPRDVLILNAIGLCLVPQGRLAEAVKVYDAALTVEPDYAPTLVNKGDALALLADFDQARAAFARAVELNPVDANALAGLASLELRRGATDEAKALAQRSLAQDPGQSVAALTLAEIETDGGDAAGVEGLLRGVLARDPAPDVCAQAESLLGDALDADGRYAEAFEAYRVAGETLRRLHAGRLARPGAPTVLEMVRWHLTRFEGADPADWVGPPLPQSPSDPARHIFFVGFPRSGTTLLEQILASHPDVIALDERQALADATRDLFSSDAKVDRLKTITAADAQAYREAYWRHVAQFCPAVAGKVFIDKYPLNSDRLGLIAKLFPEARVLFALRDPRDVVLSCFRRRFEMNAAMYELCTLEGAAALYDAVMRLVERYKAVLSLPFQSVRYESLVADLRGEMDAVCDFVGIGWSDAMLDFAETARSRGVRTPSARQVVRGLYGEGVGQWRNYSAELAPVLPVLAPWVETFGYPAG
jgi:tetratricopeptide (TPR) repeat protein